MSELGNRLSLEQQNDKHTISSLREELSEANKHNCRRWHEETLGCKKCGDEWQSIVNKIIDLEAELQKHKEAGALMSKQLEYIKLYCREACKNPKLIMWDRVLTSIERNTEQYNKLIGKTE